MIPNLCKKRNITSIINHLNNNHKVVQRLYCNNIGNNNTTKYSFEGHTWFHINNDYISSNNNINNQPDGYIVKMGITEKFDHPSILPTINFVDFTAKPGETIENEWDHIFFISTPGSEFYVGSKIPGKILRYNLPLRSNPNKLIFNQTNTIKNDQEEANIQTNWVVELKIKDLSEFNKLLTRREYNRVCADHRQTMLSYMHSWNKFKNFTA